MFDMGFTELMLIGIVALVVIGPERLPGVARTAGKYVGRLKRFMTSVKADVEQELRADELRQILSDQQKELDSLKDTITEAGRDIEKESGLGEISTSTNEAVAEFSASVAEVVDETPPAAQVVEETASVKPAVKKSTVKKPATKKSAARKPVARKPAAKKSAAKKTAPKRSAAKKSIPKKSTSPKSTGNSAT
jgi:sec-independent protein translocase protein TatB